MTRAKRLPALAAAARIAAAATAARSTTTSATTSHARLWTGFVHGDRASIQLRAIESLNRRAGFAVVVHRHEGKPAGASRVAIGNNRHFLDLTMGRELILQRFLRRRKGKVA